MNFSPGLSTILRHASTGVFGAVRGGGGRVVDTELALDIAAQVARGISALHDHGVMHRNVKPANVMVTIRSSVEHVATLIGMGLVKVLEVAEEEEFTETGSVVGTPAY